MLIHGKWDLPSHHVGVKQLKTDKSVTFVVRPIIWKLFIFITTCETQSIEKTYESEGIIRAVDFLFRLSFFRFNSLYCSKDVPSNKCWTILKIEDRRIYENVGQLEFSVSIMFFELSICAKGNVLSAKHHRYVLPSLAAICGLFLHLYDLCPLTLYE